MTLQQPQTRNDFYQKQNIKFVNALETCVESAIILVEIWSEQIPYEQAELLNKMGMSNEWQLLNETDTRDS